MDPQADESSKNDEMWAREEGIPSLAEPFIQKYLDGRDSLIAQEKQQRSDHSFREALSPMAAQASAIMSAIRFDEQQSIWNASFEDELAKEEKANIYPGMMFTLAKERMESSKLWKIVQKMPKGALLHCHLSAMGDYDLLIEETLATGGMCISAEGPLDTPEARETAEFGFGHVVQTEEADMSLWSPAYETGEWIPLNEAEASFPDGGREGFKKWLRSRMTITPEESLKQHLGPDQVWQKFTSCFGIVNSIILYEPLLRSFLQKMFSQLVDDGIRWVDIRTTFIQRLTRSGQNEPDENFVSLLSAINEELELFKALEKGKDFWGARIIWTPMRSFDTRTVIEDMKECIDMKKYFPDLICGIDFVGQEDLGRPLTDLLPEIFWFKKRCMEEGVDIPFYFHAGETLGSGDEVDENLFDAVLLGTRRIGHGFSLYKHPLLIDMVKQKKILVESCPISNEVLRLTGSIATHPLPALLSRGVACCLNNDDPAMLGQGSSGLTHDFWQALQAWEDLGLEGLASMAENSVRYASYEDCTAKTWAKEIKEGAYGTGTRAKHMKEWAKDFEKFCQWVVREYGPEHDINTLD